MNLNEECLLQFLQQDNPLGMTPASGGFNELSELTTDLRRILRHKHYVSFPPAILMRRRQPPYID